MYYNFEFIDVNHYLNSEYFDYFFFFLIKNTRMLRRHNILPDQVICLFKLYLPHRKVPHRSLPAPKYESGFLKYLQQNIIPTNILPDTLTKLVSKYESHYNGLYMIREGLTTYQKYNRARKREIRRQKYLAKPPYINSHYEWRSTHPYSIDDYKLLKSFDDIDIDYII